MEKKKEKDFSTGGWLFFENMKKESSSKSGSSPKPVEEKKERKRQREDFEKALESNGTFADLGLTPRVVEAMARIPK